MSAGAWIFPRDGTAQSVPGQERAPYPCREPAHVYEHLERAESWIRTWVGPLQHRAEPLGQSLGVLEAMADDGLRQHGAGSARDGTAAPLEHGGLDHAADDAQTEPDTVAAQGVVTFGEMAGLCELAVVARVALVLEDGGLIQRLESA